MNCKNCNLYELNKIMDIDRKNTLGDEGQNFTFIINLKNWNDIENFLNSVLKFEQNVKQFTKWIFVDHNFSKKQKETLKSYKFVTWIKKCNEIKENLTTDWFTYIFFPCNLTIKFYQQVNNLLQSTNCGIINVPLKNKDNEVIHIDYQINLSRKNNLSLLINEMSIYQEEQEYINQYTEIIKNITSPVLILNKNLNFSIEKYCNRDTRYKELLFLINQHYTIAQLWIRAFEIKTNYDFKLSHSELIVKKFSAEEVKNKNNKPKIALIVDVEGWAFYNIASQLKKRLSQFYDFEIITRGSIHSTISLIFYLQKFDLFHFFWRGELSSLEDEGNLQTLQEMGMTLPEFVETYLKPKCVTTAIYDHWLIEEEYIEKVNKFLKYVDYYVVSSKKLLDHYQNEKRYLKSPYMEFSDGVDPTIFYPLNLERFQVDNLKNRKIKIGWVGNSAWKNETDLKSDIKGVHSILKPAIQELQQEGLPIEEYFADRQVRWIPHDKMNEYYSKIDVLVCASLNEGTPNPVLEAIAAGVPIISTDVGIVSESLGKKQKQLILENRSIECMKEKIRYLCTHLELFHELSEENKKQLPNWTWEKKAEDAHKFFDMCLKHYKKDGGNNETE